MVLSMSRGEYRSTTGELVVSALAGLLAAAFAAPLGFVTASFLCDMVFTGEMTEWILIYGPLAALTFAVIAFVLTFRWVSRYGRPASKL